MIRKLILRSLTAGAAGLLLAIGSAVAGVSDFTNGQAADLVLGQKLFTSGTAGTSSGQLATPRDVAVDPVTGKVFVADTKNNRVLRFGTLTKLESGQPAEVVLGQPNFTTGEASLSPTGMNTPQSVLVDANGTLWVSDTGNQRILRFDKASSQVSGAKANRVLGQPDFFTTGRSELISPMGLALVNGHLFVADISASIVAYFAKVSDIPSGTDISNGFPTTAPPVDLAFGVKGAMFVAFNSGEAPILRYDGWSTLSGDKIPDGAIGPTLTNGISMGFVLGIATDGASRVFASDSVNHRVLVFDNAIEQSSKATASIVLGQKSFESGGNGTSATTLFSPFGLVYVPQSSMLVLADQNNNRVLRYTQGAGDQPDLTVPDISVSSTSLTVGQDFEIVGIVENNGTAKSTDSTLRFYYSTDSVITTADTEIGTPASILPLDPGVPAKLGTTAAIDSTGTFYVGACADAISGELTTTNNCSTGIKVAVEGLPDLTVPDIALSSIALSVGEVFEIKALVENSGSATSNSSTLNYFRSSDATISTSDTALGTSSTISTLEPGGQLTLATNAEIDTPGTYFVGACAKVLLKELSTTNNCSVGVEVTVTGQPDLIVPEISTEPTSVDVRETFNINATVQNAGTASSAASTLRYYRSTDATITTSDTEIGTSATSALAASASEVLSSSSSIDTPGTFFIGACADPVDGETSTDNNCSVGAQVTVAAPDLTVPEIAVTPTSLDIGETFSIDSTVQNNGTAPSDASSLRYFRSVDVTISTADTEIGTPSTISALAAGASEALSASASIGTGGTFYIGACADTVTNESSTSNNCSSGIQVKVSGAAVLEIPDPPNLSATAFAPGDTFNISVEVINSGDVDSSETQVKYYRSENSTIATSDTEIGTASTLGVLAPAGTATVNSDATINSSGIFYVGACVLASGNCSSGVQVDVFAGPDLVPVAPSVSPSSPLSQEQLSVSTSISNNGDQISSATTVRFYASTDSTVDTSDTELGSGDPVDALDPGVTSIHDVTGGPLTEGTWWIGACVETFTGEADESNNCSAGTQIIVKVGPDLSVAAPTVEPSSPAPSQLVVASTTVTNVGDTTVTAESIQFYYSTDSTIGTDDTAFGLPVSINDSLSSGQFASAEKTSSAPSMNGEFWFGACVTPVTNDANTANDCSPGTKVVVNDGTGAQLDTVFDAFDSGTDLTDNDMDGQVSPGDVVALSVTVTNVGASDASNVMLDVPAARGSTLVAGSVATTAGTITSGNTSNPPDAEVAVDIGTLAVEGTVTVSFELEIQDPFDQPAENLTVQATSSGDAVSDDTGTVMIAIIAAPDVFAELIPELLVDNDNDMKANPTDVIRYTVRIKNDGDQTADQVVFTLTPPLHGMLLSVSVQQGANVVLPNNSNMDEIQIEYSELAGNSVRVDFDFDVAVIDLPPDGSKILSLQGDVTGQNFASAITDDPTTGDPDDPTIVRLGELKRLAAPTTCDNVNLVFDPGSNYGAASKVTDKYVVIGAPDLPSVRGSGVVIVYLIVDGELVCDQVIEIPEGYTAEEFGAALDIEGDTIVVGAPGQVTTVAKGTDIMQAAIFQRLNGQWNVKDTMAGTSGGSDDKFGSAVEIDKSTILIGAPSDSENETVGSGAAYVYNFSGSTATLTTKQKPSTDEQNFPSKFGTSIACKNGVIAVGAPGSPLGTNASGAVSLFNAVGNSLTSAGAVTGSTSSGDNFGGSIGLSDGGDMLAVGAAGEDGGGTDSGAVYTFDVSGTPLMTDTIIPSDPVAGAGFGTSIAYDGDNLIAGAPGASTASSPTATASLGAAYQFILNSQLGEYSEMQKIGAFPAQSALAESQQEGFGSSVSYFNGNLVIGAPSSQAATGAAAVRLSLEPGELIFFSGFEEGE